MIEGMLQGQQLRQQIKHQKLQEEAYVRQQAREDQESSIQDIMNRMNLERHARPIRNGTITENNPDTQMPGMDLGNGAVLPGMTLPGQVMRKADSSRTVKYKNRAGESSEYELFTPEEQNRRGTRQMQDAEYNKLSASESAYQQVLREMGVDVDDDVEDVLQMPRGSKALPRDLPGLRQKAAAAKTAGEFTLTEGGTRFAAGGKVIATNPKDAPALTGERAELADFRTVWMGANDINPSDSSPTDELRVWDAFQQWKRGALVLPPEVEKQRIRIAKHAKADKGGNPGLVEAVLANPNIYDTLTATAKTAIAPDLAAAGFSGFGKQLTESAIKKMSESRSAVKSLVDLRDILKANEKYIGPIAGFSALNPYSPARKAQADIDRNKQRVGKTLEGGVLRKEDEEKYKKILATLSDTPETAIYKVDQMIEDIQRDADIYIEEQRKAGRKVEGTTKQAAPAGTAAPAATHRFNPTTGKIEAIK